MLNVQDKRKVHLNYLTVALLALGFATAPAQADLDETWSATVGGSLTSFNSEVKINSHNDDINEGINLEDDLGYDRNVRAGSFAGFWRYANKHRVRISYLPIRRSSEVNLNKDIELDDQIIKAGAHIKSSSKLNIYDVDYIYSIYRRPNLDIGLSAGLYWMQARLELEAAGEITSDDSEDIEFEDDYESHQSFNLPMPLFGLSASYEIVPGWRVHGSTRYLALSFDNISGRILSLTFKTDYYFTQHWGLGLALSTFDLDIEREGLVFSNEISWDYSGAQAYVSYKY